MSIHYSAYFDNAASAPVCGAAREAVMGLLAGGFGNPSAAHMPGREASRQLANARRDVAALIGAKPKEIIFTSGGTESNSLAVFGALKRPGQRAITGRAEHPSILSCFKEQAARGTETVIISPDHEGNICVESIERAVNDSTALVSIAHVNHETGVVADIAALCRAMKSRKRDALFHVDAAQSAGKLAIDVIRWGVDMVSLSAHKMHGMSGTGALYVREGISLRPLFCGGEQERRFRPGTENMAGIVAMGAAAREATARLDADYKHVSAIKARLLGLTDIPGALINGAAASPYILNISFPGVKSEILMNALDAKGIYISAGAACNSKQTKENAVAAYGLGKDRSDSAIRISLSRYNTMAEAERLIAALKEILPTIHRH